MKKNFLQKIAAFIFLITLTISSRAQSVPIYSENFGGCGVITLPTGWSTAGGDWIVDASISCAGGVPTCTIAGSSANSVLAGADASPALERVVSSAFSTIGYASITVGWNGFRSTGAPAVTLEWSTDNITFTPVAFTDVATDDNWHILNTINLPAGASAQATVYLRWAYTGDGLGNYVAFDDLSVQGVPTPVFYLKSSGALDLVSSWSSTPDGLGASPGNFTANNQAFYLMNRASAALTADWTVSGTGTILYVGTGTASINFIIPPTFSINLASGAKMTVSNLGTLTFQNTVMPTSSVINLNTGSTIDYAQASVTTMVVNLVYSNLTISGGADKNQSGGTTVNGILNLNGANLVMSNSSLLTLTLNGTITGSGLIRTSNSKLNIGGTGAFGTLTFGTGATVKTINGLTLNRPSSGNIILGSDLTVTGTSNFTNGTLNLNGKLLALNGVITFPSIAANGGITGSSTSSLNIGGSGLITNSLLMDQTSTSSRSMGDVFLNRTGQTLTLGNAMDVYASLTPSVGTVASGSNLTLKSSATGKARIGIIDATNGFFTGTPTVELYKPAGVTGWVNLCSAGVTGKSISDWNASFAITCPSGCPDGSTVGGTPFTSMYTYSESAFTGDAANVAHYPVIPGTATALDSKAGYWVYLGNGFPNTTSMLIPLTGAINTKGSTGAYNLSLTGAAGPENGWHLISNPYPSPITVGNVLNAMGASSLNIDNTFYGYNPNGGGNSVPFTTNSVIAMGQAFAVRAMVNGLTFTPSESWKTTANNNTAIFKTSVIGNYYWNDFLLDLTSTAVNGPFSTSAYFTFGNTYTNGFDNGKDAYSLASSIDPGLPRMYSMSNGNQQFLRNALPSVNGLVSIPVKVETGYPGVYTINPVNINLLPAGACVALYDIVHNVTHDLRSGAYTTTLAANSATNQFELRITLNPANLTSNVTNPACKKAATGLIKAQGTSAGPWNFTWKDAGNNILKSTLNSATADTLKNLAPGTYYVDINTVGSCDNAHGNFTLQASTPLPQAMFTANTNTVYAASNVPVSFTDNSTNGSVYNWNFGDGSPTVSTPNASHVFNNPGLYNVKLTLTNGACADSSSANTQITSIVATGITQNTLSESNLFVSKDANGIFVQLNFDKVVTADINVTNVLGQTIIDKKQITGDVTKVYLNIPENEKILFVTIVANGQRQTKKIVN